MPELSWDDIRQLVRERAGGLCEYCQTSEINSGQEMQIDHIDPDGSDMLENLCLACWSCNNAKRRVMTAMDPDTNEIAPLFNPRQQKWRDHFVWTDGATQIQGLTPTGRATVIRLKMNRPVIIAARQRWADAGYHPPTTQ